MASVVFIMPLYMSSLLDWFPIPLGVKTAMTSVSYLKISPDSRTSEQEYKKMVKNIIRNIDFIQISQGKGPCSTRQR